MNPSSSNIQKQMARIISLVFHPVLSPLLALIIILNLDFYTAVYLSARSKVSLGIMVAITTVILPALSIFIMKKTGYISSLQLENRKERTIPYIAVAVFYYISFYSLKSLSIPTLIPLLLFGGTLVIALTMLVNIFWKISAHMAGIGGVTGLFAGLSIVYQIDLIYLIILLTLIAGITGWSRLHVSDHTPAQLISGFVLGSSSMIALLSINY